MSFDFAGRWATAATLMRAHGIDAMFVMKPTNLAYLTGDGRPCALGLLTSTGRFIVAVPECDLASVRAGSHATVSRLQHNEPVLLVEAPRSDIALERPEIEAIGDVDDAAPPDLRTALGDDGCCPVRCAASAVGC